MLEQLKEAISLALKEWQKEQGKGEKLENGDEFVTVFRNATLIIGLEDGNLNIRFLPGSPFLVDMSLEIYESLGGAREAEAARKEKEESEGEVKSCSDKK